MANFNLTQIAQQAAQALMVLDSGEGLSNQQLLDAQQAANNLLASWTNEQVRAIQTAVQAFTLAGGAYTPAALLQFADLTTPITLPAGYERALPLGLAIELAPQYDMEPSAALAANFKEARAAATILQAAISGGAPAVRQGA